MNYFFFRSVANLHIRNRLGVQVQIKTIIHADQNDDSIFACITLKVVIAILKKMSKRNVSSSVSKSIS